VGISLHVEQRPAQGARVLWGGVRDGKEGRVLQNHLRGNFKGPQVRKKKLQEEQARMLPEKRRGGVFAIRLDRLFFAIKGTCREGARWRELRERQQRR